jgi:hypothetical protein
VAAVVVEEEEAGEAGEGGEVAAAGPVVFPPMPVWDRERETRTANVSVRAVEPRSRTCRDNLVQNRNVPNAGQP